MGNHGATPARRGGGSPVAVGAAERCWAVVAYLSVVPCWLLGPLAVYLAARGALPYVRWHAAQAANLVLGATLLTVCGAIVWGLLALDTPTTATMVAGPLVGALWLVTLAVLGRAAVAAGRGDRYVAPGWLCVPLLR